MPFIAGANASINANIFNQVMYMKQTGWPIFPEAGDLYRCEDELFRYKEDLCICGRRAVWHITLIRGLCPSSPLYATPAC